MKFLKQILTGIITLESRLIIKKYKPFIVAVTGSVGKTSTKDAVYDVLKDHGVIIRKSEKSMNSEIGLPLTVIGVPNAWFSLTGWVNNIFVGLKLILGVGAGVGGSSQKYPDCLVLEVGADHPGDIKRVVRWLKPDIAVLTRVSRTPVHVEFFRSPEEVLEEKTALAAAIKPGGTLVLFADDLNTFSISERVKDTNVSVVSYGMSEKAAVRGSNVAVVYETGAGRIVESGAPADTGVSVSSGAPIGMSFDLNIDGGVHPVSVQNILGETYVYPLLAATAVGRARGIPLGAIVKSLIAYDAPRGRMNIIPGINGSTLIDDTYNSSPDAVLAALAVLKKLHCAGTKYAILGDMLELGKFSTEEHVKIGTEAARSLGREGKLITVGQRSRVTAEQAIKEGMLPESVQSFSLASEVVPIVQANIKAGDIILVKGSQSVRMERISASLLREPGKADKLLVRQEKEWLEKK